ncbi:glycosyltransferase [Brevundimonas sp.]|uniref:glycosyltransferase n=1 Tax=Brevundimonas sp. TaxID=1871086 RepID=UPI003BA9D07E
MLAALGLTGLRSDGAAEILADWQVQYRPSLGQSRALQAWTRQSALLRAAIAACLTDHRCDDRDVLVHAEGRIDIYDLKGIGPDWTSSALGPLTPAVLNGKSVLLGPPQIGRPIQAAVARPEMAVVVMSVGAPKDLTRAIASLRSQKPRPEIVVVNSGGGDVRSRLPAGCGGVVIVDHPEILWPGAARNRGLAATRAPYVAFLASDCVARPGWVAGRMAHHRAGSDAVASAVVNDAPRNLIAWASHLNTFPERLPHVPEDAALRYGVSYARKLFVAHGLFREDLRIGEDTEFHRRIGRRAIVWAPEIRTAHRNPRKLRAFLLDQYQRGRRSGRYWSAARDAKWPKRVETHFTRLKTAVGHAPVDRNGWSMRASLPLAVLGIAATEMGRRRGAQEPEPRSLLEPQAIKAARARKWKSALKVWRAARLAQPDQVRPRLGEAQALLMLKRYELAAKAYGRVLKIWPRCVIGVEGQARAAGGAGRWEEAADLWARSSGMLPGRPGPLLERAKALMQSGHAQASCELYAAIVDQFPDVDQAYQGLATTARRLERFDDALAAYDLHWSRRAFPEAVENKVDLLLALQRWSEAAAAADSLQPRDQPSSLIGLRAMSAVMVARHDWEGLVAFLRADMAQVMASSVLLERLCNSLALVGRPQEALDLLDDDLQVSLRSQRLLKLTALLRGRRYHQARAMFQAVWSDPDFGRLPVNLFAPMMTAAWEVGGPALTYEILDRVEAKGGQRPGAANQRLLASLQRSRADSLVMLFGRKALAVPAEPLEAAVVRQVDAERLRSDISLDYPTLDRALSQAAVLRASRSTYFPDPAFVLSDALAVVGEILNAYDARRPFSLVRLGDGEGQLLTYPSEIAVLQARDQASTLRTWWGWDEARPEQTAAISAEFRAAVAQADMLGVPSLERVCRATSNGQRHLLGGGGANVRGLIAVNDWIAAAPGDQALTSCHVHQALDFWGLWRLLLPQFENLSAITCRQDLPFQMKRRFGVDVQRTWMIPAETKYASPTARAAQQAHYPDRFESLREDLATVQPGEVVLVAAGALGKIYCQWIRMSGGIAIDIGSAADFWCGLETRSVLESSEHRGPMGIEDQYGRHGDHHVVARLLAGNDRTRRPLSPRHLAAGR